MFRTHRAYPTASIVPQSATIRGKVISTRNASDVFRGNELLEVSVVDASRMDAPSILLGKQQIRLQTGQQFPIRFEFPYDKSRVGPGYGGCSLQARIIDGYGRLIYINDTHTEAKHRAKIDVRRV